MATLLTTPGLRVVPTAVAPLQLTLSMTPISEPEPQKPLLDRAITAALKASENDQLDPTALAQILDDVKLPANQYSTFMQCLEELGVRVGPLTPEPNTPGETEAEDTSQGWDGSGYDYFLRCAKHPLLDAEAEVALGRRVQRGILAKQREQELAEAGMAVDFRELIADGERANDEFVKHNIRLVLNEVSRWVRADRPLLTHEDLFQEGYLGLRRAIVKFDPEKGFRFSTYATAWIKQAISRAVDNNSTTIRVPVGRRHTHREYRKTVNLLRKELKSEPGLAEIADRMALSVDEVRKLRVEARRVRAARKPARHSAALQRSAGTSSSFEEGLVLKQAIRSAMDGLTERERRIITMRFGLGGGPRMTLEEIGSVFGVTRERVRQLEAKALVKLRAPAEAVAGNRSAAQPQEQPREEEV